MKHSEKALRHFILGLLFYPILLNVAGFFSPFWGEFVLQDEQGVRSRELLNHAQVSLPIFSLFYLSSLWHLSQVAKSRRLRALLPLLGVGIVFFAMCKAWIPTDWASGIWGTPIDALLGAGQLLGLLFGSLVMLQLIRSREMRALAE